MKWLVVDSGLRAEVVVGQFSERFTRVERDLQQWIKAAVESCLGSLGTVGALAVDEFLGKLREAIRDLGQIANVPHGNESLMRHSSRVCSVAGGNVPVVAGGSDVSSEV